MKKLRLGIIGLGRFGKIHAYNLAYKVPNTELVSVCAKTKETLDYAKKEYGITNLYNNIDDMITYEDMDAVVICTPSNCHCEDIKKCLDAGFHVFTEKPLGTTLDECEIAKDAVLKHNDKKFMIGFMRRFDKSYEYAKEKIKSGAIGTPYLIKATGMDPESQIQETIKYSYHSAGIFLDLGIHDIDLMHWFLESDATEVYANGATFKYKQLKENGDEEAAIATYKFKNGAMGFLHVGRAAAHGYHVETEIVGTDGMIKISTIPEKNLAKVYNNNGVVIDCIETFPERFEEAYIKEMEVFADCVLNDKESPTTIYDGIYSTKVGIATTKALKELSIIKID